MLASPTITYSKVVDIECSVPWMFRQVGSFISQHSPVSIVSRDRQIMDLPTKGEPLAAHEMVSQPPVSSDLSATPGLEDEEVQQKIYPSGLKFAAIMVAVCLSFTLVGLVS